MSGNLAYAWASALIDELVRHGLHHVAVCPGSRSTPLVLAVCDHDDLQATIHHDERGAAFFAVGRAKFTGVPSVVIVTSGTAAANLFPAIVEADQDATPLIVLTADRPPELHGEGANQTTPQANMFATHTRWSHHAGAPVDRRDSFAHLEMVAASAWIHSMGPRPGPVHVNLPFRLPLEPEGPDGPQVAHSISHRSPRPRILASPPSLEPEPDSIANAAAVMISGQRGVIVVGPRPVQGGLEATLPALAARLGVPIIADTLSGVRYGGGPGIVSSYGHYLNQESVALYLRPDWVLQFGGEPTSQSLNQWIGGLQDVPRIVVAGRRMAPDAQHTASMWLLGHEESVERALSARLGADPQHEETWLAAWQSIDAEAARALTATVAGEADIPGLALSSLDHGDALFVGNSLPVRDLDDYCPRHDAATATLANRGVSGIDGVIHAGLGSAMGVSGRTRIVLGDVSFLHDLNALETMRRYGRDVQVVVIENGGGAIFDRLPIARRIDLLDTFFRTPSNLDAVAAAQSFGLSAQRVDSPSAVAAALSGGEDVVAVPTEAAAGHQDRLARSRRAAAAAVEAMPESAAR